MTVGVRPFAVVVVLALGGLAPLYAQTDGLAEDLATTEAFVKICADQQPDRAEVFRATLAPPYNCAASDSAGNERARGSAAYRSQFDVISAEMIRMPKEQIQAFCESLLQKRC